MLILDAATIALIGQLVVKQVEAFGVVPKIALLSHSNFGNEPQESSEKMKQARHLLKGMLPHLEIEGEMTPQLAWDAAARQKAFPNGDLNGSANVWLTSGIEAGHMAFYTGKVISEHATIGPLLLGLNHPVHIATSSASVRGLFNYACVALSQLD